MRRRSSKVWTQRTVRFTPALYDALYDYATRYGVNMSDVAHFCLERSLNTPLDMDAFKEWSGLVSDQAKSVRSRRREGPRAPTTCSVCGELGHNAQRHDESRSSAAAKVAVEEGLTLAQAGDRFGITREAVRQALRRDYGSGLTPAREKRRHVVLRVVSLAQSGRTINEIAEETSLAPEVVRRMLWERDVKAHNPQPISDDDLLAAANAVANGASYAEAAADLGRSVQRVAGRLRAIGVASTATSSGRYDGRTARAIARVEAGESIPDACRAERCATVQVYTHFKRLRKA